MITGTIGFGEQMTNFLRAHANLLLAGAVALLLLQDVFGTHGVLAMHRSQQQAQQVEKEINQLNDENRQLQQQVKSLKTDPSAIERIAREEVGLARPGEIIFKVNPVQPSTKNGPTDPSRKP
jgi:cell division protein FtsB